MGDSQFKAEAISKSYVGKDKVCRCGCHGSYLNRGDKGFDRRLKRFEKMWSSYSPTDFDLGDCYFNISYGNDRATTAYFD
jgi:hypothetical protein